MGSTVAELDGIGGGGLRMEEWKELALRLEKLPEHNKNILRNGPKSLSEAWFLSAMKQKYGRGDCFKK